MSLQMSEREAILERATPEDLMRLFLHKMGADTGSQHFLKTPERFTKVLYSYFQTIDLDAVLSDGFADDDPSDGEANEKTLVVQTAIPFMGLCAHHLLPFFGAAAIGYLPADRVVGLSKLTRLVYAAGHLSPTTQEHITNLVADTLYGSEAIKPKGVAVLASALHGCMAVRGVESPSTRTITSAVRGDFLEVPALEAKFMTLAMEGLR